MSAVREAAAAVPVDAAFMASHPASMLALVGGAGLIPFAPGTFGALAGVPLGLGLQAMPGLVALALVAAAFVLGVWSCGVTATRAGVHDHQSIVFDETWATAAVIAMAPAGWRPVVVGFVAFRLFDILKPWPIGYIDRHVGSGLGIMLDDAVAALFALAVLALLWRLGWL